MKTKKELKEEFISVKPAAVVFQIENKINLKLFLEACADMQSRWNRHQTDLNFGSHRNKALQKDWDEFKKENFTFKILSELDLEEDHTINVTQELKLLLEMIIEEKNINPEMRY